MSDWSLEKARETYSISHWSSGYFDIGENGHVVARPRRHGAALIDLHGLTQELQQTGLSLPVLVRFTDILHERVNDLCQAFNEAMSSLQYQGGYCAVYPVKVNQQHKVIEGILAANSKHVGLEAGSKPELMIILALAGQQSTTLICNGYKDREYIRLALIGGQLGHDITIVIEKPGELDLVIEEAQSLGIRPQIGLRARLASVGQGNWQNTGGEKSKFGLSSAQILQAIDRLREAGMLECLQLLHVHLGSQIANIRDIKRGMQEAVRYYIELCHSGVPLSVIDVGGGLGIDYEGTRSRSYCSTNYTLAEYAANVVRVLAAACEEHDLPPPRIITESGRDRASCRADHECHRYRVGAGWRCAAAGPG